MNPPVNSSLRRAIADWDSLSDETYSFHHDGHTYVWNVTQALRLIEGRPREPDWFRPADQGVTVAHLQERYPTLDWNYARGTDLTRPLLFVPYAGQAQMIDGWHRLARAVLEGIPALPAFLLTQEEAYQCLVSHQPPASKKKGIARW